MSKKSFIIIFFFLSILLIVSFGTGIWVFKQPKNGDFKVSNFLGGAFILTDHNGEKVTERSNPGKFKLIYFGYTFCPDICPTGMSVISEALDLLEEKADQIKPFFITLDPQRDNIEIMAEYYKHFHPTFSNLTGTPKEIEHVAKLFRVYYKKSAGVDQENYLLDHSSIMYVMSPEGKYLNHFGSDAQPKQIASFFSRILK